MTLAVKPVLFLLFCFCAIAAASAAVAATAAAPLFEANPKIYRRGDAQSYCRNQYVIQSFHSLHPSLHDKRSHGVHDKRAQPRQRALERYNTDGLESRAQLTLDCRDSRNAGRVKQRENKKAEC